MQLFYCIFPTLLEILETTGKVKDQDQEEEKVPMRWSSAPLNPGLEGRWGVPARVQEEMDQNRWGSREEEGNYSQGSRKKKKKKKRERERRETQFLQFSLSFRCSCWRGGESGSRRSEHEGQGHPLCRDLQRKHPGPHSPLRKPRRLCRYWFLEAAASPLPLPFLSPCHLLIYQWSQMNKNWSP